MIKNLILQENGQGTVEYGLVLGVLVIAAVGIIPALVPIIENLFRSIADAVEAQVNL
ncbi:Flp family type IVb pilin [Bacillus sp. HMF5848]|uniref:Flp family type IVb pilin n=1 Tax=Bacillus sp. HMF5848 TaxID=2495421 RepID=UPI000F7928AF|nr:Flp family type IVb pilin [Bacillus sp. HMF5848]RSK26370.1 Flp family type IVb pilin [Bacillus sp. HMF5848]